jgi:predicted permease
MRLWSELRFTLRQLGRSPGLTVTILVTLALCIGANTAIYSFIDALRVKSLPYPDPDRLGAIARHLRFPGGEETGFHIDGTMWEALHHNATKIDLAAEGGVSGVNLVAANRVEYIQQKRVSAGYFRVLGIAPLFGREFNDIEDTPGGPAVTVLSNELWQRLFQRDPTAIGRTIDLRGEPFTVVGILPKDFVNKDKADVWTPLRPTTTGEGAGTNYHTLARLKQGASWNEASAEVSVIGTPIIKAMLAHEGAQNVTVEVRLESLQRALTQEVRASVLPMWGAVTLTLLIGCVNIAGLLIARSASRRREIATRLALGASRSNVIFQLLTESVILAVGGGLLGLGFAAWSLEALKRLGMEGLDLWRPVTLDTRVLLASLVISLATAVLFGLIPALDASRLDVRSVLVDGARGTANPRQRRLRQILVTAEVALGLVLLTSAGLLIQTLSYLRGLDPGFDPQHVLVAQLSIQDARYKTSASVNALFEKSLERIRALSGVESAAVGLSLPYQRPLNSGVRIFDGPGKSSDYMHTELIFVTPAFFETLRIPVKGGRTFTDLDTPTNQLVAIVNPTFVREYLHGQRPLGTHLDLGDPKPFEIVGVVADTPQHSGAGNFGPLAATPTIYLPQAQSGDKGLQMIYTWFSPNWVVREHGNRAALIEQMRTAIRSVDPRLPFSTFEDMESLQDKSVARERYEAILFSVFAGLALLLTIIGIYGLISNSVAQRTREIGIRMALGATVRNAINSVIAPGLKLTFAGIAAGLVLSWFAARLIQGLIWGVPPHDARTYLIAAVVIAIVTAVASLLPALRLVNLDPARTLRED